MQAINVKDGNVDGALRSLKNRLAIEGTLSKARSKADGYEKRGVRNRKEKEINTRNCRKNNRNNKTSRTNGNYRPNNNYKPTKTSPSTSVSNS